ncbi:hypothetical protein [Methylobacter tundripaludum]|nr:hypothetical protein [Methylobacter tundripaludum]
MKDSIFREIVAGFPYPIASSYVKLRTDECMDPGPNRLKHQLATGEATARFLGVVNLCQARDFSELFGKAPPKSMTADFTKSFERVTFGNWLRLARESLRWLLAEQAELFIPEMAGFFFDSSFRAGTAVEALERLVTLRNDISHERSKAINANDYKPLCEKAQDNLDRVLEGLRFLLEYELSFISEIEVDKRRRHTPTYRHRFKKLIGNSDDFEGNKDAPRNVPLDSQAVVLLHPVTGNYLNLDPLLIYEEAAGKKPEGKATDIFFYNGMKGPAKADYQACKHGGRFLSCYSDRADYLEEELRELENLFTGELAQKPTD